MRSLGLLSLFWLILYVPACADTSEASAEAESDPGTVDAKKQQEGNRKGLVQSLPEGWESYTHSDWLESLDITYCETEDQGSESRRKHWIALEGHSRLLSLNCEFGAYQDAFHLFVVDVEAATLKRVILRPPESADAEPNDLARGVVYMSEQGDRVEFVHLSAATGACGWRAIYSIKDIKRGGPVAPNAAFGDDDCYNGVTVEGWPEIH
ncbi:hypothetical protein OOT55_03615 [Marinimicrobium sp. C6131]|uniref:hypothetical protein n=1 Tax=Marinimicrobium sp. C6131 TaxID=3022676 RepID=UPI00223DE64B|nr:hypothetical protein [Marinimicrobium sp. C6131]UZJ45154.1 hypothetical protein OOT55_03615 [Marinimicrobium sp. C6131]